jgi:hypothetical protein
LDFEAGAFDFAFAEAEDFLEEVLDDLEVFFLAIVLIIGEPIVKGRRPGMASNSLGEARNLEQKITKLTKQGRGAEIPNLKFQIPKSEEGGRLDFNR